MWPNPQFPIDLVTFTEEILNWKLHFLCSESFYRMPENLRKLCISTKFRHQDIRWNFGILCSVIIGKIVTRYLHFMHSFFDKPHFNKQQLELTKIKQNIQFFDSCFNPKLIFDILRNVQKQKCLFYEIMWIIIMKMRLKMRHGSHGYDIS